MKYEILQDGEKVAVRPVSSRSQRQRLVPTVLKVCLTFATAFFLVKSFPPCGVGNNIFLRNEQVSSDKRVILNNGVTMPVIAAGTWQYRQLKAENSVFDALDVGYRHIDTAYNYFNQRDVKMGIRRFQNKYPQLDRYDIFITTKVPGCGSYPAVSYDNCGDDTREVILKDLEELNVSFVDLLLVHAPPYGKGIKRGCKDPENCEKIRHQWKAMQHAFLNKKARAIGVSNFCKSCLDCLLSWEETYVVPAVNQIQYHVGMGADPEGIVSYGNSFGILTQAYSPLGNGDSSLLHNPTISKIAKKMGKTIPQIALKWSLQNDVPLVTKSSNRIHMTQNKKLEGWEISDADMKILDAMNSPKGSPSFTCDL